MLESLRQASKSWVIKILFGLLIVSFVIFFGNGTELTQLSSSRPAIVVGSRDISGAEIADQFQREKEQFRARFKSALPPELEQQLLAQTIAQTVNRAAMDEAAEKLRLTLDDESLRRMIASTPAFQNQAGQFDKAVYLNLLRRSGFTEESFLRASRQDSIRQDLVRTLESGLSYPESGVDALFERRFERRKADAVLLEVQSMPKPPAPDEAALKAWWDAHPDLYTAPENRAVTALLLRVEDLGKDFSPEERNVEQAYESRRAEYVTPEKRRIQQIVVSDKAEAEALIQSLSKSSDPEKAAREQGRAGVDLGLEAKKDIPIEALADAAFAIPEKGVAPAPVETPFGWHVLIVSEIVPSRQQPLAEVREKIVAQLVSEEAHNRLFEMFTSLEDMVGAGTPLEEAAETLGLKLLIIPGVTAFSTDIDGKPIEGLPSSPILLRTLSETPEGGVSPVTALENDQGYFALRVDKLSPSALRPFEDIKAKVLEDWSFDQQSSAAMKIAETLSERLGRGEALAAVAGKYKSEVIAPFIRSANLQNQGLPPELVAKTFSLKQGEAAAVDLGNIVVAVRLAEILPADKQKDADAYQALQKELSQAFASDVLDQYLAAVKKTIGVEVNYPIIKRSLR